MGIKKHTEALRNVQRRATRMLPGEKEHVYPNRVRKSKLPSLAYRRPREDMIEMFKILTGKYDSEVGNFDGKVVRSISEHTRPFLENC